MMSMNDVMNLLPVLFVAVSMNIAAGLYYNVGSCQMNFNFKTLLSGIIKAAIVAGIFIGTAYCFEATDLSSIGVTPLFLMTSAITLYVGKAIISLAKILGVDLKNNAENTE